MKKRIGFEVTLLIIMISLFSYSPIANAQSASWETVPSPTTSFLRSVFMVSANDGWAVGDSGTIIRWNGASWETVPSPTTNDLDSVFMVSANEGWIVGDSGTVLRWNGASWNTVPGPNEAALLSVFMVSANDGWIVGSNTWRWDGVNWNWFAVTPVFYSLYMVSANDGWVVGNDGRIMRWNGVDWNNQDSPTTKILRGVHMVSSNDGWAVGWNSTILRWNGITWNVVPSPTTAHFESVFMVSANDGWIVGAGTILRWDGVNWNTVPSPTTNWISQVSMVSEDDFWAVGALGIFHWSEKTPPVASFSAEPQTQTVNEAVEFDASGSTDPDGSILSYFWEFGDGVSDNKSSPITTHSYSSTGSYTVRLTVTDNNGLTDTTTKTITVTSPELDVPEASFTISPGSPSVDEAVTFDASGSTDPDGTIVEYFWTFGDGNIGTGMTVAHTYTTAGTFTVNLTVTDNDGKTDSFDRTITITTTPPSTVDPVASFTCPQEQVVDETVTFDASGSTDPDGTIVEYFWTFGDENTGTGMTVAHTYTTAGTFTVNLTVTDNDGKTDTTTKTIEIITFDTTPPYADAGNNRKVETGSIVTFSAASSTDNVGIVSYEWDFGDETTGSGENVSHTYNTEGNYPVTLEVTDAAGNSDTVTIVITVEKEAAAGFALWVLVPLIGGTAGTAAIFVYMRIRKPKAEIPAPAKKTEEVVKPIEEKPQLKGIELPKLSAKCGYTIELLNGFIEDPSRINDRKAWKCFREFIAIAEQIEDEYDELIEIRNNLAILRRKRNEYRRAGLDELADEVEGDIQDNYVDSIQIIKEIQEKLPQLGS